MGSRSPKMDVRQEVRFAVVMYGGVSLAIYINGVAQEMYRMVRATATSPEDPDVALLSDEDLSGTERVYRRLGQMLGRDETEANRPCSPHDPIHTRFVLDVLSGSSAGGINAVYLAKALANGQDVSQTRELWLDEGDIEKLINDRKSVKDLGWKAPKNPKSLLNGQRMYYKLLKALKGMDDAESPGSGKLAPYAEELDLFVTATDMRGLPVPLKLEGTLAWEKRHRNVFHFRYRGNRQSEEECNDFHKKYNPFLAFAARATSAFPFAFEPMMLKHMYCVPGTSKMPIEFWDRFFPEYREPPGLNAEPSKENAGERTQGPMKQEYEYEKRAFGDGGYLDNKPFGYAIEALAKRRSDKLVDRKLIYVDPSPEKPQTREWDDGSGNAVMNLVAASTLARYEPIREDLQRILHRNRLIERVQSIVADREAGKDIQEAGVPETVSSDKKFGEADLRGMIRTHGVGYGGYHRIRVAAVTDAIAAMIARAGNFDPESDEFFAIRYLVRAWREQKYAAYRGQRPETHNKFLWRYDLDYRIRRVEFCLSKIDQLQRLRDKATEILKQKDCQIPESEEDKKTFREELAQLRHNLNEILACLRETHQQLELVGEKNPLHEACRDTGLGWKELREILEETSEEARSKKAEEMICDLSRVESFREIARTLQEYIERPMKCADTYQNIFVSSNLEGRSSGGRRLTAWLRRLLSEENANFAATARKVVYDYYAFYLHCDMISYPILYSTEVGEERDQIEVVRISPEDACYLERSRLGSGKLVGTSFRNFGAFFDRGFRQNDVLWGRLDGAERLITTLLVGSGYSAEDKGQLIKQSQLQIFEEELQISDRNELLKFLGDAMSKADSDREDGTELRKFAKQVVGSSDDSAYDSALRTVLSKEKLYEFYRDSYTPNKRVNPKTAMHVLSRSARVAGPMFQGIANDYDKGYKLATWAARLGQVFAGIVEVSTRDRLVNWIWRRWLVLLYAFEVFLIVVGLLLSAGVYRVGLAALAITAVLHVGTLALGDFMQGKKRWWRFQGRKRWQRFLKLLIISIAVLMLVLGVVALVLGIVALVFGPPDIVRPYAVDMLQCAIDKLQRLLDSLQTQLSRSESQ